MSESIKRFKVVTGGGITWAVDYCHGHANGHTCGVGTSWPGVHRVEAVDTEDEASDLFAEWEEADDE